MLVHAIAHDGCTDTVRESALKGNSWRKIPCRTGESNLPQRRAGSTLYQLSYIPAQYHGVSLSTILSAFQLHSACLSPELFTHKVTYVMNECIGERF